MAKIYYLLKDKKRFLINEKVNRGAEVIKSVVALNWLDAKAKLGFQLTPQQAVLLERSYR
jgi:hypothetical protein